MTDISQQHEPIVALITSQYSDQICALKARVSVLMTTYNAQAETGYLYEEVARLTNGEVFSIGSFTRFQGFISSHLIPWDLATRCELAVAQHGGGEELGVTDALYLIPLERWFYVSIAKHGDQSAVVFLALIPPENHGMFGRIDWWEKFSQEHDIRVPQLMAEDLIQMAQAGPDTKPIVTHRQGVELIRP